MNIAQELKHLKTGPSDLRKFGLLVGGVFIGLGLLFLWRDKTWYWILLAVGTPLVLLGAIFPRSLKYVYIVWMGLAFCLGLVVSTILLTLFFYLVFTPMGLLARLAGKDFLSRKLEPARDSYWIRREPAKKEALEQQF